MTKEQWKQVENAAVDLYSTVYLKVDGYDVAFKLVRVSAYKNEIAIWVGGVFKGEWLGKDCEERRRFCQKRERSLLSAKQKADFKKLPKKQQKDLLNRYHSLTYEWYEPYWSSFGALKRHLLANNKSVELVKIG